MKKKIFGILLTLVLAVAGFGLVGCGGGNTPAPGPGPGPGPVVPEVSYDDDTTPVPIDETGLLFDLWTPERMEEAGWDEEYITDYNQARVYAVTEEVENLVIPAYVTDGEETYRVVAVENLLFTIDNVDDFNYTGVNELATGIKTITIPSTVEYFRGLSGWYYYQETPGDDESWVEEVYYLENLEAIIPNNRTEAIDICDSIWDLFADYFDKEYPDGTGDDGLEYPEMQNIFARQFFTYDEENDLYYLGNPGNPYMMLAGAGGTYYPGVALGDGEELVAIVNEDCIIIDSWAFGGASLTGIVVPDGLVTIGNGAFCDSSLKEITLPEGLENIGEEAFNNCNNLEELVIPSTVKKLLYNCINTGYTNVLINSAELIENDLIYNFEVFYVLTEVCDDAIIGDSEGVHFEKTDSEVDGYNCYVFIDPFIR